MPNKIHLVIFKLALLSVLVGRGVFLLLWDAPYRSLLWDEQLLSGLVNQFGPWESWVSSPLLDQSIVWFTQFQGAFLLFSALLLFLPWKKLFHASLLISSLHLFLLAFAGFWNSHHQFGYFLEYSLQICMPMSYYLYARSRERQSVQLLAVASALTFFGHGLYAFGYYLRPGRFVDMILAIFPLQEKTALQLLTIAGTFDFLFFAVVIAALVIPKKFPVKILLSFFLLASFWGLTTAFARWMAYVEWQMLGQSLMMWGPQVIYRLIHGLAPLWLYLQWRRYAEIPDYQQTPFKASILSV